MPRQARLDTAGALHHVMIRGIERRNIFRTNKDRNDFIDRLSTLLPETKTICYAWSFMPNHAHFLIRSGPMGISYLMRKLLTGYVVSFNRRHHRTGRLFQNRYKSIICQEDAYFTELVRYIHLNPVRAKLVSTLAGLDYFAYSGHSAIMGTNKRPWQDTEYVLGFYGKDVDSYHSYIKEGIHQGRRENLSGGGLIRTIGGWSEIKNQRQKADRRILGDNDFVLQILTEAGDHYEHTFVFKNKGLTLEAIADKISILFNITKKEILSKGRTKIVVEARSLFCHIAVRYLKATVTEVARLVGMAPSAISYSVIRGKKIAEEKGAQVIEELLK
jgi:REP element-mobilizing transposase RayT